MWNARQRRWIGQCLPGIEGRTTKTDTRQLPQTHTTHNTGIVTLPTISTVILTIGYRDLVAGY